MHFVELTCLDSTKVWINMDLVVSMSTNSMGTTTMYLVDSGYFEVKESPNYILSCLPV